MKVAFAPIVIKAYDTPLFMIIFMTLFLWCGLAQWAFCDAFCTWVCAPHPLLQGFFPSITALDISRSLNKKERDEILVKSYCAIANTVRFALGCQ